MQNNTNNILAVGEKNNMAHIFCQTMIIVYICSAIFCMKYIIAYKTLAELLVAIILIWTIVYMSVFFVKRIIQYKTQKVYLTDKNFVIENNGQRKIVNFDNFACYGEQKFLNSILHAAIFTKDGETVHIYATEIGHLVGTFLKIYPQYENTGINDKKNQKDTLICIILAVIFIFGFKFAKKIPINSILPHNSNVGQTLFDANTNR